MCVLSLIYCLTLICWANIQIQKTNHIWINPTNGNHIWINPYPQSLVFSLCRRQPTREQSAILSLMCLLKNNRWVWEVIRSVCFLKLKQQIFMFSAFSVSGVPCTWLAVQCSLYSAHTVTPKWIWPPKGLYFPIKSLALIGRELGGWLDLPPGGHRPLHPRPAQEAWKGVLQLTSDFEDGIRHKYNCASSKYISSAPKPLTSSALS